MDKLSPELISLVIDNLGSETRLAPYATISRTWQREIERRSFTYLRVTSDNVPTFKSAFSHPNQYRRASVRSIEFEVCLQYRGETRPDYKRNQAAFRDEITSILQELGQWEEDEAASRRETGSKTSTFGDVQLLLKFKWHLSALDASFDPERSPAWLRYFELCKDDLDRIPQSITSVTSFIVRGSTGKALHPTTSCQLASRMPRLEQFDVTYCDPPFSRFDLRKAHHTAMAEGLTLLTRSQLPHLKQLAVRRYGASSPGNHSVSCPDFTDGGVDELCESIRHLVQEKGVQELDLERMLLSSDLFYDRRRQTSQMPEPSQLWPSLRTLSIYGGIVNASGAWLFTGRQQDAEQWYENPYDDAIVFDGPSDSDSDDGGESEDDDCNVGYPFSNGEAPQHYWRTRPDHETFDTIVRDLAGAVLRMSALQGASLYVRRDVEDGILVRYSGPEQPFFEMDSTEDFREIEKDPEKRRVKVLVPEDTEWEPPSDIVDALRKWAGDDGEVQIN